jgi:hypothetical protein
MKLVILPGALQPTPRHSPTCQRHGDGRLKSGILIMHFSPASLQSQGGLCSMTVVAKYEHTIVYGSVEFSVLPYILYLHGVERDIIFAFTTSILVTANHISGSI